MKQLYHLSLCAANLTLFLSFGTLSPVTARMSLPEVQIAQNTADYENTMDLGFEAAAKQDFKQALKYFERALKLRPGDANAQRAIANINEYLHVGNDPLPLPSGVGAPSVRDAGGTRTVQQNCLIGNELVAIIPENQLGLTSLAKPTILFYIRFTPAKSLQMRFEDESTEAKFYERTITTPAKPGLAKFDLAEFNDAPSLEVDKTYRWTLTVRCDLQDPSADVSVHGSIRRIALEPILLNRLQKVSSAERARLYAINRLWYDTVKALAEARQSHPTDAKLAADWDALLKSVGLDTEFSSAIGGDR